MSVETVVRFESTFTDVPAVANFASYAIYDVLRFAGSSIDDFVLFSIDLKIFFFLHMWTTFASCVLAFSYF